MDETLTRFSGKSAASTTFQPVSGKAPITIAYPQHPRMRTQALRVVDRVWWRSGQTTAINLSSAIASRMRQLANSYRHTRPTRTIHYTIFIVVVVIIIIIIQGFIVRLLQLLGHRHIAESSVLSAYAEWQTKTRNSSEDEIANVNFLYDDIAHALQNTINSCINSGRDRRGYVLERSFTKVREITQCNGNYAVQDHSRSPILVPIESSYTTSYY